MSSNSVTFRWFQYFLSDAWGITKTIFSGYSSDMPFFTVARHACTNGVFASGEKKENVLQIFARYLFCIQYMLHLYHFDHLIIS